MPDEQKEKQEEQQEEQQEDNRTQVVDQIGQICKDNDMPVAVFLSISENDEVIMWWKGSMVAAGEISAKFVRRVKEEVMKKLEI